MCSFAKASMSFSLTSHNRSLKLNVLVVESFLSFACNLLGCHVGEEYGTYYVQCRYYGNDAVQQYALLAHRLILAPIQQSPMECRYNNAEPVLPALPDEKPAHLYLSAHAGISMVMKSGLYKKNRKDIKVKNEEGKTEVEPIVKQDRSAIPFVNIGISYSLFK